MVIETVNNLTLCHFTFVVYSMFYKISIANYDVFDNIYNKE